MTYLVVHLVSLLLLFILYAVIAAHKHRKIMRGDERKKVL